MCVCVCVCTRARVTVRGEGRVVDGLVLHFFVRALKWGGRASKCADACGAIMSMVLCFQRSSVEIYCWPSVCCR